MTNKKARGLRKKSRDKFTRKKPRLTIDTMLKSFPSGTDVHVDIDSSVHSGLPHQRLQGLTGRVTGRQGNLMVVSLNTGKARKKIIAHPAHLKEKKEPVLLEGA